MTSVITTFSKDGYDLYGSKMIDAWIAHWPSNYTLTVYTEGYDISQQHERLNTIDINLACPDLQIFKDASQQLLREKDKKHNNRIKKTVKWCHKVYAMAHAIKNNSGHLIFLDGDTRTLKPVVSNLAEQLVQNYLFAVHFEKLKDGLHFETGLVVFNLNHDKINWLADTLVAAYDSLDIYNMNKTWDGFLFAEVYKKYNLPVKDLSAGAPGVFSHPLIKKYIVHDVGPKKYHGTDYDRYTGRKSDI